MIAYRYDIEQDNKYDGEQPCQRDPIASLKAGKDVFLLPGNCTYVEPPEQKDGYDIVFDIAANMWKYAEAKKEEMQKPEPYVPTAEDKLNLLDGQYQSDKQELMRYYLEFAIAGDEEGMAEIKQELAELARQYDIDFAELEGAE